MSSRKPPGALELQIPPPHKKNVMAHSSESSSSSTASHADRGFTMPRKSSCINGNGSPGVGDSAPNAGVGTNGATNNGNSNSNGNGNGGGNTTTTTTTNNNNNEKPATINPSPRASMTNPLFLQAMEKRPFTAGVAKGGGGGGAGGGGGGGGGGINLATAIFRNSVNGILKMSTPEGIIYSSRFDRDQRRELQLIPFPVRNERSRLQKSIKSSERVQRRLLQEQNKQATAAQLEQSRLEELALLQRKRRCAKTFEEMILVRVNATLSSNPSTSATHRASVSSNNDWSFETNSIQKLLDNGIISSVTLLCSVPDTTIQTHCARALYCLSRVPLTRKALITGGIVNTVKCLLRLANSPTKQDLAAILCHVTEETDLYQPSGLNFAMNHVEVMLQEGLERILARLFTTCAIAETKRISALAISNLSCDIIHVKHSVESFCQLLIACTRTCVDCVDANCFLIEAIYNVSLLAAFHATLLSENIPRFLMQLAFIVPRDHQVLILKTFCCFALTKLNRLLLLNEICLQFLSQMLQSDLQQVKEMASILLALLSIDESSRVKICSWLPSKILIIVAKRHQPPGRYASSAPVAVSPSSASAPPTAATPELSPSDCHAVEYPLSFVVRNLCRSSRNHQELVDNGIAPVLLQMTVSQDIEVKKNGISAGIFLANGLSPEALRESIELITRELFALSISSKGDENLFVVRALYVLSCNDECLPYLVNSSQAFALALHLAKLEETQPGASPQHATVVQKSPTRRSQQPADQPPAHPLQQPKKLRQPAWQSEVHCLVSAIMFRFAVVENARASMLEHGFFSTLMQLVKHSPSAKSFAMIAIYLLAQEKHVFPNGKEEIAQLTSAMSDGKIIENAANVYAKQRATRINNALSITNSAAALAAAITNASLGSPTLAHSPNSSPRNISDKARPKTASCAKLKTGSSTRGGSPRNGHPNFQSNDSPTTSFGSPTTTTSSTSHTNASHTNQEDDDEQTLRSGVTLLAHLATIPVNRSIMVRNGVFRFLRKLKYSTDENLLVNSAFVIYCMTTTQESAETLIKEDGLSLLIHLSRSSHIQVKELCMLAICRISSYMGLEPKLIENGIISAVMIMALVATDSTSIKVLCVKSLVNCLASKNCVRAMTDSGILWALTSLSMVDSPDTHLACAVAFCNLSSMPYMLARFYDAGAPKALLHLIQVSDDRHTILVAIKALANLVANEKICTVLINEGVEKLLKSHFEEPQQGNVDMDGDGDREEKRQIVAMVLLRVTSAKDVINIDTLKTGIFIWMQQIMLMKQDNLVRNCLMAVHELTSPSSIHAAELEVEQVLKILMQVVARYEKVEKQDTTNETTADRNRITSSSSKGHEQSVIDDSPAVEALKAMVALTSGSPTNSIIAATRVNVRDEILSMSLWILYNLTCQVTFLPKLVRSDILQFIRASIPEVFGISNSPGRRNSARQLLDPALTSGSSRVSPARVRNPGDFKLCAMILHNLSCASLSHDEGLLASLVNLHAIAILDDIYFQREDLKEICAIAACNLIVGRVNSTRVLNENGALLLINFVFGDGFAKRHHLLFSIALRKLVNAPGNQQIMVDAGIVKAGVRILSLADVDLATCENIMAAFCLLSKTSRHLSRLLDDGLLPCVIRIAENKNTPHAILAFCFELLSNLCATDFEKHVTRPDINVVHCLAKLTDHVFPVTTSKVDPIINSSFYERGDDKPLPLPSLITSMLRVSYTSLKKNLEMYGSYTVPTRKWLPEATPSPQSAPLPVCEDIQLLTSGSSNSIPSAFTGLFQKFEPIPKHALVRDEAKEEEASAQPIRFGSVANVAKFTVGRKRNPRNSAKQNGQDDPSESHNVVGEGNGEPEARANSADGTRKRNMGSHAHNRVRARTALAMRKLNTMKPSATMSFPSHHGGSTPNLFPPGLHGITGSSREQRRRSIDGSRALQAAFRHMDEAMPMQEASELKARDQEEDDDEDKDEGQEHEHEQEQEHGEEEDHLDQEEEEEEEVVEEEEQEEVVIIPISSLGHRRPSTALR